MSADTDPRKSPCANTGSDSLQNLPYILSNNPLMSIQRSRSGARILAGWVNEARRLHKLARNTKREIHDLALQRHLEAVANHIGRYC
jgi:hypothetical protein